jgi:endonuclease YncB( thermonuclease family)
MVHPYQILLPLLSLFLVRVDLTDLYPLKLHVQVIDIHDGDTLTVQVRRLPIKVRLSRIDAPEMKQPFHFSATDAGKFSRNCLKKFTPQMGTLTIFGFDMYHRSLGDYEGVNLKAVAAGCAGIYPHAGFSSVREKNIFLKALIRAKKERRGVWARGGYILPKKWRKISKRNGYRSWHSRGHSPKTYRPGRKFSRTEY